LDSLDDNSYYYRVLEASEVAEAVKDFQAQKETLVSPVHLVLLACLVLTVPKVKEEKQENLELQELPGKMAFQGHQEKEEHLERMALLVQLDSLE
jgi:hypothetical protein